MQKEIDEYTEEEISRAMKLVKIGNPLRRVKHGSMDTGTLIKLKEDQEMICYQSKHWSTTFVADHTKEVPVSEMLEIRSGWHTDNFHKISNNREFTDKIHESCCFSIVFRHPFLFVKTLDFVADTEEVQEAWLIALRYLLYEIRKEAHYFNEEKWLKENFVKADLNNNGSLSFKELWKLLTELNVELSEKYAKSLFKNADFRKSAGFFGEDSLDFEEFLVFFRSLTQRSELKSLMTEFSTNKRDYFTPLDLKNFIENVQKMPSVTEAQCKMLIDRFEPEVPNKESFILSANGFLKFLLSEHGAIFNAEHRNKVFQDMNLPLHNYYIQSSHNTYLIGHQLKGDASTEAYILCLKSGIRVLELDIWDGTPEPIVTHGHTLVNPITLRAATKTIAAYAFVTTPYPLILSLEVHCTLNNQKFIARLFKETFKDSIWVPPHNMKVLPSPEQLKYKILMKGWKIPHNCSASQWNHEVECEGSNDPDHEMHKIVEDKRADASEKITALDRELSDITCLAIQPIKNIYYDKINHPFYGVANFSEKKLPVYLAADYDEYVKYANKHLIRIYPYGLRTDSSNLNPIRYWNAGCQIVALNMQHADLSTDLNDGLFSLNGAAGYVLKPEVLRKGELDLSSIADRRTRMTLNLKIISAQYLPKPNTDNDIIDPYVVVEVHGLPCDAKTFKTNVVNNNGFNPVWNAEFKIELKAPEFALIRFSIIDYDKFSYDDFVGECTVPAISLNEGFRYVHLRTGYTHSDDPSAALFVRTQIERKNENDIISSIKIQSLNCSE